MNKKQTNQTKSIHRYSKILMMTVTICILLGSSGLIFTFIDFKISTNKMRNKVKEFNVAGPYMDSVNIFIKFNNYSYDDYWQNLFGWGGSITCDYTLKIISKNIFRLNQDTEIKLVILDNDNIEIAYDNVYSSNISRLVNSQGDIIGYSCTGNTLYAPVEFFNTALNALIAHNLKIVE